MRITVNQDAGPDELFSKTLEDNLVGQTTDFRVGETSYPAKVVDVEVVGDGRRLLLTLDVPGYWIGTKRTAVLLVRVPVLIDESGRLPAAVFGSPERRILEAIAEALPPNIELDVELGSLDARLAVTFEDRR